MSNFDKTLESILSQGFLNTNKEMSIKEATILADILDTIKETETNDNCLWNDLADNMARNGGYTRMEN